ncbi:MAG: 16S rRNA (uracil(1498)-N(3))-methyltransferase [Actinobacteria bacterium]|nr:MAG: 16S rRNA (uracil(1498)-N(3))-methyltransferase [Actinomycetota bacterium]
MSAPVFYIADPDLQQAQVDQEIPLSGSEGRHAVSVLRVKTGEDVEIVDGCGLRIHGTVVSVSGKENLRVRVSKVLIEPIAPLRITVVQALPKGEHGELSIDLLTQVGVDVIVPWAAGRSITRWAPDRIEKARGKWQAAVTAAAKQARRARWPVLGDLATTVQVAELITGAGAAIVLHEEAITPLLAVPIADREGASDVVLIVGPEGGIGEDEREIFRAAGAFEARLGPSVLRSSAAGAVATAVLSATRNWGRPSVGGSTL